MTSISKKGLTGACVKVARQVVSLSSFTGDKIVVMKGIIDESW